VGLANILWKPVNVLRLAASQLHLQHCPVVAVLKAILEISLDIIPHVLVGFMAMLPPGSEDTAFLLRATTLEGWRYLLTHIVLILPDGICLNALP
jgi:hypothetical protein